MDPPDLSNFCSTFEVGAGKLENRRSGSILGTGDSEFVVGASLNASDTSNVPIGPMDLSSKENLVPDSSMNPNFAISDFSNFMSIKRELARKVIENRSEVISSVPVVESSSVEKQPALSHSPVFFCFCAFKDVS
ncbi:hypothetical protein L6452_02404 [Arctium lappa]|uniref:Uncharacterized protein n=1 Tax=Arctium lappa TaxID=4217 RepID=A0ACB9FJG4_ARCLA|nr:hypothetical protein L6452_02404 [Arctium lappa]